MGADILVERLVVRVWFEWKEVDVRVERLIVV